MLRVHWPEVGVAQPQWGDFRIIVPKRSPKSSLDDQFLGIFLELNSGASYINIVPPPSPLMIFSCEEEFEETFTRTYHRCTVQV